MTERTASPYVTTIDTADWRPVPMDPETGIPPEGSLVADLGAHPATGGRTLLFKLPPGATTPIPESHPYLQEQLVLEGELLQGGTLMSAGTYIRMEPGVIHGPASTDTGVTLYVINHGPTETVLHRGARHGDRVGG
jgi:quercetin dioxygenase-like cupin family protein